MANYPRTGSILDSTTHTGLSTQIIILVNNDPVGAVQTFSIKQSRQLRRVTEIGTDGTIEIVPTRATEFTVDLSRVYFDGLSLPEGLARAFRNIHSQRIPFDIVVIDQFSGTGDDAIITTFHNCWFASLGKDYKTDDYVIVENCSVWAEYLSETRGNEAVALSQGLGGSRQVSGIQIDDAELQADTGLRRGALDFPGLISAAY